MKPFKTAGVSALLDAAPDALLVPLTINRAYQFTSKGLFPLQVGVRMEYIVHEPIENTGDTNAIIAKAEAAVRSALKE
jgi:1-acyl-sn-glycerol-3-phosphate acyltransferase